MADAFRTEKDPLGPKQVPADALYGVTMQGDGITAVISQRIRGQELASTSP